MDFAKLEMTVHSGNNLKDVKYFGTNDPLAKVWIDGEGMKSKFKLTYITKTAIKGDTDPVWESCLNFGYVPVNKNYFLIMDIKHDGKIFDREIGQVKVPFADLLAANEAAGDKVTYPVTTKTGEKQGYVTFSYKFTDFVKSDEDEDEAPEKKKDGKGKEFAMSLALKFCIIATAAVADEASELLGFF